MKTFFVSSWRILKQTVINFVEDDSMSFASSIAFYTIFSLPAILIIALSIGGAFYERTIVEEEILSQVSRLIGSDAANEVQKILHQASFDASTAVARAIGIGALVFSATTVFISLQTSLNKIWGIKPKPKRGLLKFLFNRLLSLAMVASIGFLLLVSLVIDAAIVLFQHALQRFLAGTTLELLGIFNIMVSMALVMLIFALLFKVLPDAKIEWRDVWVGAAITTVLFTLGKFVIGLYLGNSSFNSAYGAAGSLVVLLVWIYYSTVIFLFGAELTSVYAEETGSQIRPYDTAVKVQIVELEKNETNETTGVSKGKLRHS